MKSTITAFLAFLLLSPFSFAGEIKEGDTLQLLSNLHPDTNKMLIYTLNYQREGLIPACSEVEVIKLKKKAMVFKWKGVNYTVAYEKHTRKAGIAFLDVLSEYFGPSCNKAKLNSLGAKDQEGVLKGRASLGMTRDGVLFAMGRPPIHATPDLSRSTWIYWINRFAKKSIEFNDKGVVVDVR